MWESRGYVGTGNVNGLVDSIPGRTAIIAGNGEAVFDELKSVIGRISDPLFFAVNDVGMYLPKLDHWVSLHRVTFPGWIEVRTRQHLPSAKIHASNYGEGVNYAWIGVAAEFILSGYFAMQVAYWMGAARIILCGIPGNRSRRFFDMSVRDFGYGQGLTRADKQVRTQLLEEMEARPEFKSVIRSCGGWTKEFFGAPEL